MFPYSPGCVLVDPCTAHRPRLDSSSCRHETNKQLSVVFNVPTVQIQAYRQSGVNVRVIQVLFEGRLHHWQTLLTAKVKFCVWDLLFWFSASSQLPGGVSWPSCALRIPARTKLHEARAVNNAGNVTDCIPAYLKTCTYNELLYIIFFVYISF